MFVDGVLMNEASPQAECFFDTITQTVDGTVYLQAGTSHANIVRVDGLDTIRRLPEMRVRLTAEHVAAVQEFVRRRDAAKPPAAPPKK
jgi:hypothetical protein